MADSLHNLIQFCKKKTFHKKINEMIKQLLSYNLHMSLLLRFNPWAASQGFPHGLLEQIIWSPLEFSQLVTGRLVGGAWESNPPALMGTTLKLTGSLASPLWSDCCIQGLCLRNWHHSLPLWSPFSVWSPLLECEYWESSPQVEEKEVLRSGRDLEWVHWKNPYFGFGL